MATQGYDGASIADIAAAAGLTSGLVHYHFRNKLEILVAVAADLREQHERILAAALAPCAANPKRALDTFLDVHLAVGKNADPERLACWIAVGAEAIRHAEVRAEYELALEQLADTLEQIIAQGVRTRVFHTKHSRSAAVALLAVIQGYFTIAGSARALIPNRSAARSAKAMARGLLAAAQPRGRNES